MVNKSILPSQWRAQSKLTMAAAAELVGIRGKNPARTWQRWEAGEREPPVAVMLKIEGLSDRQVDLSSWVAVRQRYLSKRNMAEASV